MKRALLALLLSVATVWAGPDFDAGNKAFDEGKFLEARQNYGAAVSKGEWSANLFYNLGNADERIGATGLAMLNYERALALQPGHPEARANLKFLREKSLAKLPTRDWQEKAFGVFDFNRWLMLTSVLGWLALFTAIVPIARRRRLSAAGVFGLVLACSAAGYAGWGAWYTSGELDAGVIIAKQAEARQGPADRAALADVLPAGSRVRVLSVRDDWTYCRLPGGGTGWIPTDAVERIRLSS